MDAAPVRCTVASAGLGRRSCRKRYHQLRPGWHDCERAGWVSERATVAGRERAGQASSTARRGAATLPPRVTPTQDWTPCSLRAASRPCPSTGVPGAIAQNPEMAGSQPACRFPHQIAAVPTCGLLRYCLDHGRCVSLDHGRCVSVDEGGAAATPGSIRVLTAVSSMITYRTPTSLRSGLAERSAAGSIRSDSLSQALLTHARRPRQSASSPAFAPLCPAASVR